MKAILISIKPKWCASIAKGDKTIEVRTSKALASAIQKLIDEYGFAEFYVYCTKGKPNLWLPYEYDCFELDEASQPYLSDKPIVDIDTKMNGKVIFKFRCYYVKEYPYIEPYIRNRYNELSCSCLSEKEILDYSTIKEENGIRYVKTIYAIPISNLKIFDTPKELSEFYNIVPSKLPLTRDIKYLTKAPQNFCYIEVEG